MLHNDPRLLARARIWSDDNGAKVPRLRSGSFLSAGGVLGAGGDEVDRVADEKPVKTLESERALVRVHARIVTAQCESRKKFEK